MEVKKQRGGRRPGAGRPKGTHSPHHWRNGRWRGDEVRYFARQRRLRVALGPAAERQCVDCDRQASGWSLNACVPAERLRTTGQDQGRVISIEDADYSPRCRSCTISAARRRTPADAAQMENLTRQDGDLV